MTAAGTSDGSTASAPSGPTSLRDLFAAVGGALARRLRLLTGDDEARARGGAEALFVRYYSRFHLRGAGPVDTRARWAWIYRVATSHALRTLPDDASPGAGAVSGAASSSAGVPPWPRALPTMQALRGLDEAAQAVTVLGAFDGLSDAEIAEVLELEPALVARKRADAAALSSPSSGTGAPSSAHPSRFALDRDRRSADVAAHLDACGACRAVADDAEGDAATFTAAITPAVEERLARAVRAERARLAGGPRWKRIAWLGGAFVIITVMAFAVARPRDPKPDEQPFRGPGGASRAKAAGLQITARRGNDVGALQPGMFSRLGDRLHFRVRAEGPRYLEVRVRSLQGQARIFPGSGAVAVQVRPGQTLDRDYVLEGPVAAAGKWLVIEGLFSEREFPLDQRPGRDIEVVPVRIDVER
jgi:DNA-directed RNA polymerase specialized sigma24 family protein